MRKIPNLTWIDRGDLGDTDVAAEIAKTIADGPNGDA